MRLEEAVAALGEISHRAPYAYASSWALEELEILQPDGGRLRVIIKHLDGSHCAKPPFVCDPAREIEAYGALHGVGLGIPRCYASGRWWLVLEKVAGTELWQRGDLAAWQAAARWARQLHDHFQRVSSLPERLLVRDVGFYRTWQDRARARAGALVEPLLPIAERAAARLVALPQTLIHGELYASNVLIAGERVAVIDWEMIGLGCGLVDLAALATGWPRAQQEAIAEAYGEVHPSDLAAARLLLALQWLGWVADWHPPAAHRRDWLAEARDAAEAVL